MNSHGGGTYDGGGQTPSESTAVRYLVLLLLLASSAAFGVPPPPSISGVYLGTDRVCRVVFSRWMTHWVQLDLACVPWVGMPTDSLTTLYSPGVCPNESVAWIINPWPVGVVREYISLRGLRNDVVLDVVLGTDPVAVANGVGRAESWYQLQPLTGPEPYTCSPAVSNKPRG